jgi:hypothetical protein
MTPVRAISTLIGELYLIWGWHSGAETYRGLILVINCVLRFVIYYSLSSALVSTYSDISDTVQIPAMPTPISKIVRRLVYVESRKISRNFTQNPAVLKYVQHSFTLHYIHSHFKTNNLPFNTKRLIKTSRSEPFKN